jgi:hypothetical protein
MTADGKIREHTSSVGTRMGVKFYNIVGWFSFAGSADVHISETRCGSKRVGLRWDWKKNIYKKKKG